MPRKNGNLGNTLSKQFKAEKRYCGEQDGPDAPPPASSSAYVAPECSVTHQGDLAEFLSRAELLGARFNSDGGPGGSLRLLSAEEASAGRFGGTAAGAGVLAKAARERRRLAAEELRPQLRIPRRPAWSRDAASPAAALEAAEREEFMRWREAMAALEARDGVTMTPYEKNLDFWRQLWRVIERSRAVVQILDARDPLFFYSADLDAYARESGRRTAVLLNKCDLLSPSQLAEWRRHFEAAGQLALFFSAKPDSEDTGLDVLSPDSLVDALAQLAADDSSATSPPVVGLVGYPNVGKSSTINALLRSKKVPESATPGRTKNQKTKTLGDRLILCDCPGLVMPQFVGTGADLVVHGVLPIDNMRDCLGPAQLLCDRLGRPALAAAYGLSLPEPPEPLTAHALLTAYAEQHGYTTGHGMPHLDRAARDILKDFVSGARGDKRRLTVYCQPPPDYAGGAAFNAHLPAEEEAADGVVGAVGGGLKLTDFDRQFFDEKTADIKFLATGRPLSSSAPAAAALAGKPWKRHNNSQKEKLRRTYRHLEQ